MDNKSIQANIPDKTKGKDPGFIEKPWINWHVQFHPLLPPEEISGEIPQLETFLTGYLRPYTVIKIKFSFKYAWNQTGADPRAYLLWIFLRPHPAPEKMTKAPAGALTIVKDNGAYVTDTGKYRRRSTKNTVKLTPPAT